MESRADDVISELFKLHGDEIYRYALVTLRNEQDALDVVQETFYRAFKSWENFRSESSTKTWVMHIARNYMFDMLRRKKSDRDRASALVPLMGPGASLDSVLEVTDLIDRLPEHYRQIITLRYFHQLTLDEMVKVLGWTHAKVKMTLHRATKRLQKDNLRTEQVKRGGVPDETSRHL